MNYIPPKGHFESAGNVLPFQRESVFKYHIIFQSDAQPLPMRLTITDGVATKAEIPDNEGNLGPDFAFYQHLVNDRSKDAWPQISEDDFNMQIALLKQAAQRKLASFGPDFSIVGP